MDVERMAAQRLADALDEIDEVQVVLEVPPERPSEFVSVELGGTTGDRFRATHTLIVQAWADSRRRAAEIADEVREVAPDALLAEPNVFSATPTGTYRWPDPDSGQARYQLTIELTVNH